jgi:hypothetical protein
MPFSWLACINLAIAVIFNLVLSLSAGASFGIDNAAHLGGMGGGILVGLAYFGITAPPFAPRWHKVMGYALLGATLFGMVVGGYILCRTDVILYRYMEVIKTR